MSAALIEQFDLLATSTGGIAKLRELILSLAVRGQLVPQDSADEPASEFLKKIRAEKDRLIAEDKIKRDKQLDDIGDNEKPFALPESWAWIRFGDASINRDGERIPVSSADREKRAKTYDYYGASGVIDQIDGYLFDKTLLLIGEDGANLINRSTPIAFLAHGKYWVNNHAHVIDTTHANLMSYLCLYINAISLEPYVTGTAQPKMNQAKLNSIVVALPPLAEQSRIVAKVEELMALCDRLEAEQDHAARVQGHWVEAALDQLAESADADEFRRHWQHLAEYFDTLFTTPASIERLNATLLQLAVRGKLVAQDPNDAPASELLKQIRTEKDRLILEGKIKRDKPLPPISEAEKPYALPEGWEWVRLNDIYDVRDGTHDSPKFHDKGIPLVTSKNIYSGVLDLTNVKFISEEDHQQISVRSKVDKGDILFAMIGSIGNPVIVDVDVDFSIKNMALFKRYNSGLSNTEFLLLSLKVAAVDMKREAAGGVQSFISLGGLRKYSVPLPPLAEQSRIVAQVEQLLALTAELKARLSAAQTKQAHLAETLIGEVV